jgi:hypothetical protein
VGTQVESDLRSWSREVLEVPNPHLGGLPPCPYAKQAWADNKVHVVETDNIYATALEFCVSFTETGKELVVLASYNLPELDVFSGYVAQLNETFPSLHCMEFHPDHGAEDAELDFLVDNDWESNVDDPYCMVFIQDLGMVVRASDKLQRLGYYKSYPDAEYKQLVVNRKRRLNHGYETSCDEEAC